MTEQSPLPPRPAVDDYEHADTGAIRHGHRSQWVPLAKIVGLVLVVALVSAGLVAGAALLDLNNRFQQGAIDIGQEAPDVGPLDSPFSILVVGVDNAAGQGREFGERSSTLNDVNILLHVAEGQTVATAVSLPRDLQVENPECTNEETGEVSAGGGTDSLNRAMGRGGLPCVVDTIELLTGMEIDYAALMSFSAVVAMTNAIGGVPVCLAEPISDPKTHLDLPAGEHVIAGDTALAFLRSRYGVGDGSDLARISSQQVYLASLVREIKSDNTLGNIPKLYQLANVAADHLRLSTSLASPDTMVSMALALRTVDLDKTAFVQYPVAWDPNNWAHVVPVRELADQLFARIASGQPVILAQGSTGPGSVTEPGEEQPTSTPTPTQTPSIDGLEGQMATDHTCTVANAG